MTQSRGDTGFNHPLRSLPGDEPAMKVIDGAKPQISQRRKGLPAAVAPVAIDQDGALTWNPRQRRGIECAVRKRGIKRSGDMPGIESLVRPNVDNDKVRFLGENFHDIVRTDIADKIVFREFSKLNSVPPPLKEKPSPGGNSESEQNSDGNGQHERLAWKHGWISETRSSTLSPAWRQIMIRLGAFRDLDCLQDLLLVFHGDRTDLAECGLGCDNFSCRVLRH